MAMERRLILELQRKEKGEIKGKTKKTAAKYLL
jgi:hypothetical protein